MPTKQEHRVSPAADSNYPQRGEGESSCPLTFTLGDGMVNSDTVSIHCEKVPWWCMPLNKCHQQADQSLQLGTGTSFATVPDEEMLHWEQRQTEWEGYS